MSPNPRFDHPACDALFFDSGANLRTESVYLEIGR
jgi:hypothetical protein